MLLVIDIGNTNIVIGAYEKDDLIMESRISTNKISTLDEYGLVIKMILDNEKISIDRIKDIIISSVVPELMNAMVSACKKYFKIDPKIVLENIDPGMTNLYDNPSQVGADRIVNAVAAYEKYGGPLIVIDLGTAITFDVISRDREYIGGAILPGIKISSEALFARASKLTKVEIIKVDNVIGKNTEYSIQSGLYYGYLGAIDSMVERIIDEIGESKEDVKVVATGGFSDFILEDSKYVEYADHMLTLEGLKFIYENNR